MKNKKQLVVPSNNRAEANYPSVSPVPDSNITLTKRIDNLAVELGTTPSREEVAVLESLESTERAK